MDQVTAIRKAAEITGSQAALAASLGTVQGTVSTWLRAGRIGADKALLCHHVTKGKVSAHDLRPDLYPRGEVVIKRKK